MEAYMGEAVKLPGTYSPGGIDSMLAPRTEGQQRVFSGRMLEAKGKLPKGTTERAERIRKIPLVGSLVVGAYTSLITRE